MHITQNATQEQ